MNAGGRKIGFNVNQTPELGCASELAEDCLGPCRFCRQISIHCSLAHQRLKQRLREEQQQRDQQREQNQLSQLRIPPSETQIREKRRKLRESQAQRKQISSHNVTMPGKEVHLDFTGTNWRTLLMEDEDYVNTIEVKIR